jgi:hypothetical protein
MPIEIKSEDEFLDLSKRAISCRVKRTGDIVKLKLRTKKTLYVYKTNPDKADILTKRLTIDIIEI